MSTSSVMARRLVTIDQAAGRFRVHRDAYRCPEIFEAEKELIFAKCWLYLGHGTELPNKGDFLSRTVAGRDLIFEDALNCFFGVAGFGFVTVCRQGQQQGPKKKSEKCEND